MKSKQRFVYMLREKVRGMYYSGSKGYNTWSTIQEARIFNQKGHLTQAFPAWKTQPERYEVVSFLLMEAGVYEKTLETQYEQIPLLKEILASKL